MTTAARNAGARRVIGLLDGPNEPARGLVFWLLFGVALIVAAAAPAFMSRFEILNTSNFLINGFVALGLGLIWGFAGILSLGQAAFVGIAGYAYGIIGINLIEIHGNTDLAIVGGLLVPTAVAAMLGFIMFYARLRGVYVAILMLVVTLLFETFLNQTAGPGWFIGDAHLGGNNGLGRFSGVIRKPPSLTFGYGEEPHVFEGKSTEFYYLVLGLLVIVYLGLRALVNSRLGLVLIAVREDAPRTESLGYDIRLIQLAIFCLGAFLSAISGVLYVSWGNFITPAAFSVYNNILPVIWVAVAGRTSLTATVVGALVLVWLSQRLAVEGDFALVVLGSVLVVSMMVAPRGLLLAAGEAAARLLARSRPAARG